MTHSTPAPGLTPRLVKRVGALFPEPRAEGEPVEAADSDPRRFPEGAPMAFPDPTKPYPTDGTPYPPPDGRTITLVSLDPATVALGAPSFVLRAIGTGFEEGDVIKWNGLAEPTTFVSATELTTGVNMDLVSVPSVNTVQVMTALGAVSEVLEFAITDPVMAEGEAAKGRKR